MYCLYCVLFLNLDQELNVAQLTCNVEMVKTGVMTKGGAVKYHVSVQWSDIRSGH